MSSKRFAQIVDSAYRNNDLSTARDAYNDWQASHCLHPFRQQIYDSHLQVNRIIMLPCGRCYHCMESKINEWVTRMYAHAEDFKNVYFVTLTYRTITDPDQEVNKLLLEKLKAAMWHLDAYNSTRHMSYSPCLLVKKHYQDFLKRLRKNTGIDDLTYVLSGEYGSKYGRPHFHLVLFTNKTITKADIVRAWSVALFRRNNGRWIYKTNQVKDGKPYLFPIGSVDFNDLVSNGTFNTTVKIKVDGTYLNAARCFSYVCKYVVKRDTPNLNRLNIAYNGMFHRQLFVKLFDDEIQYSIAKDWLLEHGFSLQAANHLINNQLKHLCYEKVIYDPKKSFYSDGIKSKKKVEKNGIIITEEIYPLYYLDFKSKFSPFCEFSRGVPIGSLYAKRNIQEFTQGVFTRPLLQDSGYVVPSYFRDKAKNYLYGLRKINRTISGCSFAFGSLQNLLGLLENADSHHLFVGSNSYRKILLPDSYKTLPVLPEYTDVSTGERIILLDNYAHHYMYNRHTRLYEVTKRVPVADWIRYWCSSLKGELDRYNVTQRVVKENLRLSDAALCMLTDLGSDPASLCNSFELTQKAFFDDRQKQYNNIHKSVE